MASSALPPVGASPLPAVVATTWRAGLLAGTLDISAAVLVFAGLLHKASALQVLQSVASGLLGPAAYRGGMGTALLGLGLHYLIATAWAALYAATARAVPALRQHWVLCGVLYGAVVWSVMNLVVVPLSRARPAPLTFSGVLINFGILVLMVGLPIAAVTARRYGARAR
ncbi:hypothetical protein GCM10027048_22550 [Hymenobacter coalescens]